MELQQLRYVVAVARAGNLSRAAKLCHVSQPALSQQLAKLERELEHPLFTRAKRAAKLTPRGEAFLRRAVHILQELDAAKHEALGTPGALHGPVRVGAIPTIAPYLLPRRIVAFHWKHPDVEVVLHETISVRLLRLVQAYAIDFALIALPTTLPYQQLEICRLFTEELRVALPAPHRLARQRTVALADLADEPMVVLKTDHCLTDQVLGFCQQQNLSPKINFRCAQLETVQQLVAAGAGLALVPAMAMQRPHAGSPVYRSLAAPQPTREIVTVWPKERPLGRAALAFLKLLVSGVRKAGKAPMKPVEPTCTVG
jgi:LysR family hydrogen peroxide-inducible transcriptional activator